MIVVVELKLPVQMLGIAKGVVIGSRDPVLDMAVVDAMADAGTLDASVGALVCGVVCRDVDVFSSQRQCTDQRGARPVCRPAG